jgi:hypothetical protein
MTDRTSEEVMSLMPESPIQRIDAQLRTAVRCGPEKLLPAIVVRLSYAATILGIAAAALIWWRITQTVGGRGHWEMLLVLPLGLPPAALGALVATRALLCTMAIVPAALQPTGDRQRQGEDQETDGLAFVDTGSEPV